MKKLLLLVGATVLLAGCTYANPTEEPVKEYKCHQEVVGKVVGERTDVHKDFVFTGAVWSTRVVIIQKTDGSRTTADSDTLIVGDEYSENVCAWETK